MRNQPNHTSSNQQHYDHTSEGNGGQIHKVLIGFAPALWVLRHLNCQYSGNPPSRNLASLIERRHAAWPECTSIALSEHGRPSKKLEEIAIAISEIARCVEDIENEDRSGSTRNTDELKVDLEDLHLAGMRLWAAEGPRSSFTRFATLKDLYRVAGMQPGGETRSAPIQLAKKAAHCGSC
jgi:hypothetical protein